MKKLFITGIMLAMLASFAFAQSGGMMDSKGHQMGSTGMMDQNAMMSGMMDTMHQMSGMMGDMGNMMKKMTPGQRQAMADVMSKMSKHMMEMSTMMKTGMAPEKEMKKIHDDMIEMHKKMSVAK